MNRFLGFSACAREAVGSLAAKTDKLDARVLAELARRDLVPEVHVPTFADRELN